MERPLLVFLSCFSFCSAACIGETPLIHPVNPSFLIRGGQRWHETPDLQAVVPANGTFRTKGKDQYLDFSTIGIEVFNVEPGTGGWGTELGFTYGQGDYENALPDLDVQLYEASLGVRKTWELGQIRPNFGVGFMYLSYDYQQEKLNPTPPFVTTDTTNPTRVGLYAHSGVIWRLDERELNEGNGVLLGFDVRGVVGKDTKSIELVLVSGWGP